MKLSQSNFNLRSSDCYLVRSYLIATVSVMGRSFSYLFHKKGSPEDFIRRTLPADVTLVHLIDTVSKRIKGSTVQLKTTSVPIVVSISDGTTIT